MLHAIAEVVRETEFGFAVQFLRVGGQQPTDPFERVARADREHAVRELGTARGGSPKAAARRISQSMARGGLDFVVGEPSLMGGFSPILRPSGAVNDKPE